MSGLYEFYLGLFFFFGPLFFLFKKPFGQLILNHLPFHSHLGNSLIPPLRDFGQARLTTLPFRGNPELSFFGQSFN